MKLELIATASGGYFFLINGGYLKIGVGCAFLLLFSFGTSGQNLDLRRQYKLRTPNQQLFIKKADVARFIDSNNMYITNKVQ